MRNLSLGPTEGERVRNNKPSDNKKGNGNNNCNGKRNRQRTHKHKRSSKGVEYGFTHLREQFRINSI